MKLPDKKKTKKQKMKKKTIAKPKKEKVLVVAQEFKFARLLSGNEKKTRDRVLKTFKKWLMNCFEKKYEFKEDDFIRVWKGLFYAVWMSDKPLVQEDLCDSISEILDLFPPEQIKYAVVMSKAGFKVLATEWYGIDHHRMDKFLMLVRRYLRGSLRCLSRCKWSLHSCKLFSDMLCTDDGLLSLKTPQYARNATSMVLHIIDCYLEELSKVSKGKIPDKSLTALLFPFTQQVCNGEDSLSESCRTLLNSLIKQSDLGLEYESATRAWEKMGCPAGGPDALQLVSDDEEESPEDSMDVENGFEALDPRAGRVDVTLVPLPVPSALIAEQIKKLMATSKSKGFKRARMCLERFEHLSRNKYPLKIPDTDTQGLEPKLDPNEPVKAATRLSKLEKNLVNNSDELALRGLSRKHRKRLLAKSRAGLSIVDEVADRTDSTNGEWQVESTEEPKEVNKEDKHKKNKKRKLKDNKQENNKKAKVEENAVAVDSREVEDNKVANGKKVKVKNVDKDKTEVSVKKNIKKDTTDNKIKKDKLVNNNDNDKKKTNKIDKQRNTQPILVVNKVKNYQKQVNSKKEKTKESPKKKVSLETPKKVKFVLKNNSMQGTGDYYQSVRQSPNIPFDSSKQPSKTNLKPSTPSPINPFFRKKLKMRNARKLK